MRDGVNDRFDEVGAGDQGMMFGYACDDTPDLMPMPIWLAHRLAQRLAEVRKDGTLDYLRPDGKTQVSIAYEDGVPKRLSTVLISSQHAPGIDIDGQMKADLIEHVIKPTLPEQFANDDFEVLVNPTGAFELGGPHADCGLTGRKIIVDTYGGMARHGGGAFSGKDPTKVDRSAAYAVRHVAKNVVAAGIASRCEVQVAYAIGVSHPISLMVETFGTSEIDPQKLPALLQEYFDLRPAAIIERLDLRRPIFRNTAAYGHFGRSDRDFTVGAHRPRRRAGPGGQGACVSECSPEHARSVRVQPDVPAIHRVFDYALPDALARDVRVGTIVRVPLHGRRVRGWVLDPDVDSPEVDRARLRALIAVVSAGPPVDVVDLCRWGAWRWAGPLATFLRAASPPNVVPVHTEPELETGVYPPSMEAPGTPLMIVPPDVDLAGLASRLVAPEGSSIVIDPDTDRGARLVAVLETHGREVMSVRSDRSAAELTAAWDRARAGACIVVGGRTAVWAPVPDLARVVVVDEADEALEEERAPTWNARDVAIERMRRARATIRVATPAPTVDVLVALDEHPPSERVPWPRVTVVDTRDEQPGQALLTSALADELRRVRDAGARSVCVLNRKGRARLLACRTCGELARCEQCGATVQEGDDGLACARCGTVRPSICLHCHGTRFRAVRPGVTRVRDDLGALLPRATVAAVDATTEVVPDADVLIGTEAVLHRTPPGRPVGLVSFLELDQELLAPRARAAEQALWLLVRAVRLLGTREARGVLLLQTRLPEHEVVVAARRGEPLVVAEAERARRRVLGWPPFGGAAELSGDAIAVRAACDALRGGGRGHGPRPRRRRQARAPPRRDRRSAVRRARRARARGRARAWPPESGRRSPPDLSGSPERASGNLHACPVTCCGSSAIPC